MVKYIESALAISTLLKFSRSAQMSEKERVKCVSQLYRMCSSPCSLGPVHFDQYWAFSFSFSCPVSTEDHKSQSAPSYIQWCCHACSGSVSQQYRMRSSPCLLGWVHMKMKMLSNGYLTVSIYSYISKDMYS